MAFVIGSNGFIGSHMLGITEPGVICMAGISDTTCEDKTALQQANVRLPVQLYRDAQAAGLPFIYASSASVYGNGEGPLNEYARSKAYLDACMVNKPLCYGLRFFNVYGKNEWHKGAQASLVFQLKNKMLPAVFMPHTRRDFVHVLDCVEVARWILQEKPPGGIYDVGTGDNRSIEQVVNLLGGDVANVPMPDALRGKYQFSTRADLRRLRDWGYSKPFLTLEEGVKLL